jgi:hypothetical protein
MTSDPPVAAQDGVGAQRDARLVVLESHNHTWMFDEVDHVFSQIDKDVPGSQTEWRPYDRLIVQPDSDAFLVVLDAEGSRVLRARRHVEPCSACEVTQEFSLDDLQAFTRP